VDVRIEEMVFVYRGAGKKQAEDADPCQKDKECQRKACDIQWCLSRNNYNQSRCIAHVKAWEDCCTKVRLRELQKELKSKEAQAKT